MKNTITTYKLFTLIIFVALFIPSLFQEGMFLDGVTYAAISKNLAKGYGDFFNLHYTKTLHNSFVEQPPLVFIIESLFFKLLGFHFYTEKVYTFLTVIFTIIGIMMCWKGLATHNELKENYWLPILLWLCIPIVSWSYNNNLLENTMSIFTTFSVFFILKSLKNNKTYLIPFSSILIICAFLSKGFVGLFPIVTPLIFGIIFKENKKSVIYFFLQLLFIVVFSLIIISIFPEIKDNLFRYFNQQVLPSIKGEREITTNNRFKILFDLLFNLSIIILLFMFLSMKRKSKNFTLIKNFLLFLLIGISASFPLIISLKQREFYLTPSTPFYALAFSSLLYDSITEKITIIPEKTLSFLNKILYITLGMLLVFSISQFDKYSRDEEIIKDVYSISNYLNEGDIISCSKETWRDWTLHAYLSRVSYISLDCDNKHTFFLINKNENLPIEYKQIIFKGNNYMLLRKY